MILSRKIRSIFFYRKLETLFKKKKIRSIVCKKSLKKKIEREILKRIRSVLCKVKIKNKKRFLVYEKPDLLLETNKNDF